MEAGINYGLMRADKGLRIVWKKALFISLTRLLGGGWVGGDLIEDSGPQYSFPPLIFA